MFCEKCGGLLNQYHTKENCARVRTEIKESKKPAETVEEQPPKSKKEKAPILLMYLHYFYGVFRNLQIYRINGAAAICRMYRMTQVEMESGTDFFEGVYVPKFANRERVTELIGKMANPKGVQELSSGSLYYSAAKINVKGPVNFVDKYLLFLPNGFSDLRFGLEAKLEREWRLKKEDCKEILAVVKDNFFSAQK